MGYIKFNTVFLRCTVIVSVKCTGVRQIELRRKFLWDFVKRRSVGSWNSDTLKLFSSLNMGNIYHNLMGVNLTLVKEKLLDTQMHQWETNIVQVPKLRTYCTFKRIFSVEPYVYKVFNRAHRLILAPIRNSILPLKIETGRYTQIPIEFRLCMLCNEDQIENECHFLPIQLILPQYLIQQPAGSHAWRVTYFHGQLDYRDSTGRWRIEKPRKTFHQRLRRSVINTGSSWLKFRFL